VKDHAHLTDSCLDAETMAAWADGGLSGEALESVQAHVADCARCQALAGALARIEAAAPSVQPSRYTRGWLAWLVPLTAAAAGVALWVAVPRDRGVAPEKRSTSAPASTAIVARQPPAEAPTKEPAALADGLLSDAARNARAKNVVPGSVARQDAAADQIEVDKADRTQPSPSNAIRLFGTAAQADAGMRAAAPTAPGAVPSAAQLPAPLRSEASTRVLARAGARGVVVVASPDPSIRWRIAGSVVERSTDGGGGWEDVPTGVTAELTAGAAPSTTVCWVVGRGGVVLLSTDGRSWRHPTFPEPTDLSSVSATDALVASVTTADGRVFVTTDAGLTWTRRPPQDF